MSIGYVAGKSGQQSPGIIDMYGTTGGLAEYRAAILASRGFTVLAVAFFNYDDLPKDLSVIDLHYFDVSLLFFVLSWKWMLYKLTLDDNVWQKILLKIESIKRRENYAMYRNLEFRFPTLDTNSST